MAIIREISNAYNSEAPALNIHTTSSIDFTGCDCIIVAYYHSGSTEDVTISDSDGNTYVLIGTHIRSFNRMSLYSMVGGTFGSKTISVTIDSGGIARASIISIGYSGVDQTTPVYDSYVKTGATGGTTQVVTTTKDNDFILSFLGASSISSPTVGAGQNLIHFSDGAVIDFAATEELKATAGADTQSFSHGFAFDTVQGHFALSEAVGGGGPVTRKRIFLTT